MATILGFLTVKIGADTDPLKEGSKEAQGILQGLSSTAKNTALALGAITAASITAAVALGVHLTRQGLESIDTMSKLSYRLGGTVEALQALEYAGELAGIAFGSITKASGALQVGLAEAARHGGKANDELKRLGLNAKDLLALDIDERLAVIADRMFKLGYTTAQQADALKQFKIKGQEMLLLFEGGGKTIRSAKEEINAFGVAVSQLDAIKVEMANEAWKRFDLILRGVRNQLATALAPAIKFVGDYLTDLAKDAGGFGPLIAAGVRLGIQAFGEFLGVLYDVKKSYYEFRNFFSNTDYYEKLLKTLGERPDSKNILEWYDELVKKYEETAKKINETREKAKGAPTAEIDRFTDAERKAFQDRLNNLKKAIETEDEALKAQRDKNLDEEKELERKRFITKEAGAKLRADIEVDYEKKKKELIQNSLEESFLHEDELENRAYNKRLVLLQAFEKNRNLTVQQATDIRTRMEEAHSIKLAQIASRAYSNLAGIVDTALGQISQVIGKEGGAAFEVMKAISYATALVKGYEAVVSAYAAGTAVGGPAMGAAFAAVAAAGVAAQIAALSQVKPNQSSSGGLSAGGGGAGAATAAPVVGGNQTLTVSGIQPGQLFTSEFMRDFAERLIEFQRQGGDVILH